VLVFGRRDSATLRPSQFPDPQAGRPIGHVTSLSQSLFFTQSACGSLKTSPAALPAVAQYARMDDTRVEQLTFRGEITRLEGN